jgi:hypothetical protein
MEFRSHKAIGAFLAVLLAAAPTAFCQHEFRYQVWHGHSRPPHITKAGGKGTLTITGTGVSFEEGNKSKHSWQWTYVDIQQLEISSRTLRVLTYKDDKWKLGADREYRFDLTGGETFTDAYAFLKDRVDQRFVAVLPDKAVKAAWEIPVKHLLRFGGSQGVLSFGEDRVVYTADKKDDSRTWRYPDIENVSNNGPYQLTITTYERARSHYGNLKGFNFQLKEKLDDNRYNELWMKVNQAQGLKILDTFRPSTEPRP